MGGLIFASSNNYLNKDAMICHGGNSYINNFCFFHGSSHVPRALQAELSSSTSCISEDEGGKDQDKVRTTHYYIWLPFILAIIAIMTKLPWILWKNVLERGLMKKLVADMDQDGSKTAKRFLQVVMRGRTNSLMTNLQAMASRSKAIIALCRTQACPSYQAQQTLCATSFPPRSPAQ